jgi:UDP-N-acetylmuramoyl-L-alanyl-D-glutamate--2,6-diaminopimelate ligase
MDYHATVEDYRAAKGILFEMLEPGAVCVLNADDPNWEYYSSRTRGRVVSCSLGCGGDVRGVVRKAGVEGVCFDLVYGGKSWPVEMGVPGVHNVRNALGAAACMISLGAAARDVAPALETFGGVPGRLERLGGGDFDVFVDYAHTDGALETVLSSIKPLVRRRLIVVFGAGGDRDRGKRPRMAAAVERHADLAVLTSDNPRSEDPLSIIAGVRSGFERRDSFVVKPDRREAIGYALAAAGRGDVVVIAGKGHEDYQVFADRVEHFDDREVAREILSGERRGDAVHAR